MKIYCVATVGRQIEGEILSLRFEKAYKSRAVAELNAKDLNKVYTETVNTPTGPVQFVLERGIHEMELDETE